jgi:hypothetical protein
MPSQALHLLEQALNLINVAPLASSQDRIDFFHRR